ncbi:1,2-phenylacetyl-CoA epoxidase subunit PaaC [Halostella pelagica]|uniref:1,2-phenylacetyl-CoA epoxidase subunit PaaC n=1 Tax=Halostella pelagica TaxID=2583824 RepID=UPI001080E3D3|nr:1,2-phenylacetyl-CoA epoxidase subunit PaaC [Halostella pelagica]
MTSTLDPDDLSDRERTAVEHLLFRLADDELVLAERYFQWEARAPSLRSGLALATIAQDEFSHARLWYDLLQDFGHSELSLIYERDPGEFRHSTLPELRLADGNWAGAVVRGYFYDVAEDLRLASLESSTYPPIADRLEKVRGEEEYHRKRARSCLERLAEGERGRERLQNAVDRLFPHALTLFEPVDENVETDIVDLGVRRRGLDDVHMEWLATVEPFLESNGLRLPIEAGTAPANGLSDVGGRAQNHTDDWDGLHAEMRRAYRERERVEVNRIVEDPDDI